MRILIVNNNMHIGGVQKALINLLWNIHDRYDITLMLFSTSGIYLKDIPPNVKVQQVTSAYRYLGLNRNDVKDNGGKKIERAILASITHVFGRKYAVRFMSVGQKQIEGYDVAISYLHNGKNTVFYGGCNDFVLSHVNAKKKVAFLHCDYLLAGADTKENADQYSRFDKIAACSEGCKKKFLIANPLLKHKTMVVSNCHRYEVIKAKAETGDFEKVSNKISIVTVARLGKEKGVARAVQAISMLGDIKDGLKYYIIGDGIERLHIQRMISDNGLKNIVIMCGEQVNPYGYMKAADLLLIPSLSEAAPLVINEAASLGTPILSTATSSANEMIMQCGFGWVCENSVKGIADAVYELLKNPVQLQKKREFLCNKLFNNDIALNQFENLLK